MPDTLQLSSLITYVVSQLADMGASFGKTKLVKLLYLIDVENYRMRSRKLSGLDWLFYHYGPYAVGIDRALKQLDLDIPQEEVLTAGGRKAIVFKPSRAVEAESEDRISGADKVVVDRVLKEWGLEELNPILSHVYFHTEPMKDAQRGEVLDFAKIRHLKSAHVASRVEGLPSDHLREMRAAFQKVRDEHLRKLSRSLDPQPRLDEVFWNSLMHLDSDEQYSVPKGDVEMAEELKELLRQQGESDQ